MSHPLLGMTEVVEHLQHSPDWELGCGHQDQEVADAVDPFGIADHKYVIRFHSKIINVSSLDIASVNRLFEFPQRQAGDDHEEQGDEGPEGHQHHVADQGGDPLEGDVQHEVEVLADVVGAVEPADAHHLKDGDPENRHSAAILVHDLENILT